MKIIQVLLFSIFSLAISTVSAQDKDEFKPSGKPEVLIFTNFNSSFSDGENVSKFDLTRAYFGYGYNFSPTLSGRLMLDVGNPGVGKFQMTALLKYGYLQYHKEKLTVKFGLTGTNQYDVQEKFWGYRYIYKSFQDEYGMGPSADLGLSAAFKFNNVVSADVIIQNGEGYKSLDNDSALKAGVGVTIHPIKSLTFRGYYDTMKKNKATQQTIALMAGYTNKYFSLAAEYNNQVDNSLKDGQDYSGYSFYGTYFVNTKINLFARYDYLNSENKIIVTNPWNYAKDGQLMMAGFEYSPVKGIKISPNFQRWSPRSEFKSVISTVFMNVEIKL